MAVNSWPWKVHARLDFADDDTCHDTVGPCNPVMQMGAPSWCKLCWVVECIVSLIGRPSNERTEFRVSSYRTAREKGKKGSKKWGWAADSVNALSQLVRIVFVYT